MYIDLMSLKYISAGGSKYWFLAVDEATHMKFSMFKNRNQKCRKVLSHFLKNFNIRMV